MSERIEVIIKEKVDDQFVLTLKNTQFKGTTFTLTDLQVGAEGEDGSADLSFNYATEQDVPEQDKPAFEQVLRDLILQIITDAIELNKEAK